MPEFARKVEEFRRSSLVKTDVETILSLLSKREKDQLLKGLLGEKGQASLPQIRELEMHILEMRDTDLIRDAIDSVERLAGRIRRKIVPGDDKLYAHTGKMITNAITMKARIQHMKGLEAIASSIGAEVDDTDKVKCPGCGRKIDLLLDRSLEILNQIERSGKGHVNWDNLDNAELEIKNDEWDAGELDDDKL